CRWRNGAEVIGQPGDPSGAGATAQSVDQLLVQRAAAQHQHEVGLVLVDRALESLGEVATAQAREESRARAKVERPGPHSEPLQRTDAMGRAGVVNVVEFCQHQDGAFGGHSLPSAAENCRSWSRRYS